MAEPEVSLDTALKKVQAPWDEARTERTLAGIAPKRARRRARTVLAASAAALLVLAGGAAALRLAADPSSTGGDPAAIAPVDRSGERAVSFADGSQALLLDASAQVIVDHASESAIEVRLPAGRARFEVTPHPDRAFVVVCDQVVVQVLGTGFELIRQGARTHVQVLHGRVAVSWPGGTTELGRGEGGWFPRGAPSASAPSASAAPQLEPELQAEAAPSPVPKPAARERARPSSWRQHAEQGEFQEAYKALAHERVHVSDDVEELLLAADAARLSGHAAEAVPYLQRVVDRHRDDPRAPLAAFTLGGVLMNQLGRPREAEASYARARALSPSSALSQDALARQVEAAYRASDAAAARALALEYLAAYPKGRRVQAVRRFGGLP